jgi:hypothetical protein
MTAVYDAKKLRTMNDEELQLRAAEILRDLFTMRIQGVAKQLMQPPCGPQQAARVRSPAYRSEAAAPGRGRGEGLIMSETTSNTQEPEDTRRQSHQRQDGQNHRRRFRPSS